MNNKEKEKDYEDIIIPNWRYGVPESDSVLKKKIQTSKTFGLTYLYLCEMLQKNRGRIRATDLGKSLKINNGYAYQILDEFVKLGYFRKVIEHKGKGGSTYFIPNVVFNIFIRESFINEAKKWCDYSS